jgi:hypothetical protein
MGQWLERIFKPEEAARMQVAKKSSGKLPKGAGELARPSSVRGLAPGALANRHALLAWYWAADVGD